MIEPIIPKEITYNKNINNGTSTKSSGGQVQNGNFTAPDCTELPKDCLSIEQFLSGGGGGAYNLLSVYAYGIFKIQVYKDITPGQ